jgi:hypothetical protein
LFARLAGIDIFLVMEREVSRRWVHLIEMEDVVVGVAGSAARGPADLTEDRERCIKQFVMLVSKIARFRSNRLQENRYIVRNVTLSRRNNFVG